MLYTQPVATGTVRWFSRVRGYGFIAPDAGGDDVFVHFSNVADGGHRQLDEGCRVSFETKATGKGVEAVNVTMTE